MLCHWRFHFLMLILLFSGILPSYAVNTAITKEETVAVVDSIPNYRIGEVMVVESNKSSKKHSIALFQMLDRSAIGETNGLQVSDAVKFFSGVTVKDYGGIGGMKSVSVRSMGAHHTAVAYDGITISDCQTGQIDIGRYSLENVDLLSLNIGDGNDIFQPARMFASSGLLNIRTREPVFETGKRFNGKVGFKTGSFGLWNPDVLLEARLSDFFNLSVSAEALTTDGNYPFKLPYGDAPNAYTTEVRRNNDVNTYRLESTLFGRLKNGQQLEVKGYYYQSDRGLPGAVILYNPYSSQHLWDKNAFVQAHFQQDLSSKFVFQANGKYNWSNQRYLNPDFLGSAGREDYTYKQEELYMSSSLLFKALRSLSFSFSADGVVNKMASDMYQFASPSRYSALANVSAKYRQDWMVFTGSILSTSIREKAESGLAADDYQKFSPSFNLSVQPFDGKEFYLRTFYKESFRMPSFNDLYYSAVGNTKLKPENSKQWNVGCTYSFSLGQDFPRVQITGDVYHNRISDKIMAIPTKNIFVWSMVNLGKVDIQGVDWTVSASQGLGKGFKVSATVNHSYQRALDITTSSAKEYRNQIAYAPRIFGSARLALETPWLKMAYAMLYSGHRYVNGQNLAENDLPGYSDHSISVERGLTVFGLALNVRAEVLNLLAENYEIVRNFPMPGRSSRRGLKAYF